MAAIATPLIAAVVFIELSPVGQPALPGGIVAHRSPARWAADGKLTGISWAQASVWSYRRFDVNVGMFALVRWVPAIETWGGLSRLEGAGTMLPQRASPGR
jgi:hypothetical protein